MSFLMKLFFLLINNPFSIVSDLPPSTHSNVPLTVVTSPTSLTSGLINNSTDNACTTTSNNNSPAHACTTAPISCESMESPSSPPASASITNNHPMVTHAKAGVFKPKIYQVSTSSAKPLGYKQALLDSN